jgi:ABC-type glycerol-3-phosphate transport system substrate-binding protein
MKKTITRLIALTLSLLFMLVIVAACGEREDNPKDTSDPQANETTSEGETTRLYPDFPDKDYGGAEFHVLRYDSQTVHGWSEIPNDIAVSGETGETLNDAIYTRNRLVEERFGVKIVSVEDGKGLSQRLQASVLSGTGSYDLVDQCLNEVGRLFNLGLIVSYDTLDIDLSMPWFDQNSVESFTMSGKKFAAVSDVTFVDKLSTVVAFYNKDLAEKLEIPDFYEVALSGDWTLDQMLSYATLVSADMNSDSKMDQNDSYLISCQNDGSYYLLHSAGIYTTINDGTTIKYNLNNERAISALEKIFSIMTDQNVYFNRQTYKLQPPEVAAMFANDQALFMLRPVQSLYDLRKYQVQFGIIPIPKFDASQDDYCVPVNSWAATIICVPKDSLDYERIALVFEAMAVESYYNVMPPFYDEVLGVKLVKDSTAAKVLDIVFANRLYDIGFIWNFGNIRGMIVVPSMTGIASAIQRTETVVESAIKSFMEEVEKLKEE